MKHLPLMAITVIMAIDCLFGSNLLGCEQTTDTNNSFYEGRHVDSVYLINELEKPITIEMHRSRVPIYYYWRIKACTQRCTLQPNDKVYLDTIVYYMSNDEKYCQFPGFEAFNYFKSCYDTIKINYNDKQYVYTNMDSIKGLLYTHDYWNIKFNEGKKNNFGWE